MPDDVKHQTPLRTSGIMPPAQLSARPETKPSELSNRKLIAPKPEFGFYVRVCFGNGSMDSILFLDAYTPFTSEEHAPQGLWQDDDIEWCQKSPSGIGETQYAYLNHNIEYFLQRVFQRIQSPPNALGEFTLRCFGEGLSDVIRQLVELDRIAWEVTSASGSQLIRFENAYLSVLIDTKEIDNAKQFTQSGDSAGVDEGASLEDKVESALRLLEEGVLTPSNDTSLIDLEIAKITVTKELRRLRKAATTSDLLTADPPVTISDVAAYIDRLICRITKEEFFGKKEPSLKGLQTHLDRLHESKKELSAKDKSDISTSVNIWKDQLKATFFFDPNDNSLNRKHKLPAKAAGRNKGIVECTLAYSPDHSNGSFRVRETSTRTVIFSRVTFPKLLIRATK